MGIDKKYINTYGKNGRHGLQYNSTVGKKKGAPNKIISNRQKKKRKTRLYYNKNENFFFFLTWTCTSTVYKYRYIAHALCHKTINECEIRQGRRRRAIHRRPIVVHHSTIYADMKFRWGDMHAREDLHPIPNMHWTMNVAVEVYSL